jgi:chromosomal replication initiator protein
LTGPENELALAAARSLARGEQEGISPLVVHGSSGVGKSRLLAGLVAECIGYRPQSVVAHFDVQAFAAACTSAAGEPGGGGWAALRERLRAVNLFVLEDLDGLARVPFAWDELTHTLDALEAAGAGMAVSSRTAPSEWLRLGWPRRLVNRLLGGLTVRIDPPSLASRRRYLLQCADRHQVALQAEAVESLAFAADGYRTLAGWVVRLALEARLRRAPGRAHENSDETSQSQSSRRAMLDLRTVATVLGDEPQFAGSLVTVDMIGRAVSARFGVGLGELRGPGRRASIVEARHLAMHLARTCAHTSLAMIGSYFGGRDPATVRYACKAALLRLNADPALAAFVAALERSWQKSGESEGARG